MRRRLFNNITSQPEMMGGGQVADIVLVNKTTNNRFFVNYTNLNKYPLSKYTPIGVVAVPSSHDYYKNGCAGVIALNYLDIDESKNFQSVEGYKFENHHCYDFEIDDYFYIYKDFAVPVNGTVNSQTTSTVSPGVGDINPPYIHIPLAGEGTVPSIFNNDYKYLKSSSDYCIAPPYNVDGSKRESFGDSEMYEYKRVVYNNSLYPNSKQICQEYYDWYEKEGEDSYYEAGWMYWICSKYKTVGTNEKEWYVPNIGELIYFVSNRISIRNALYAIRDVYNIDIVDSVDTNNLLSCNICWNPYVDIWYVNNETISFFISMAGDINGYVRPFIQI